ncbi:MAG TPA: hypothetical protein PKV72_05695 [Candidatus Peribacteria bacterium]|nr:hypothetical protein [Candidatus Peribacteria bacterium]
MGKTVPPACTGDKKLIAFAHGEWNISENGSDVYPLEKLAATFGNPAVLKIRGINEQTAYAILLYLRALKFHGKDVSLEDVIDNMHPPEGQVYQVMQLATREQLEQLLLGNGPVADPERN